MEPSPSQGSPYFINPEEGGQRRSIFLEHVKSFGQRFQYYARQVWPWIYRLINFLVYETIKVIKGIVKIGLQQVGMFKE